MWSLWVNIVLLNGAGVALGLPYVRFPTGEILVGKYLSTRGGIMIKSFLGIPYAKPPVGELRFKSPQPVEPWAGLRLAMTHPRPCLQPGAALSSEDCLYLNVYTPIVATKKLLPVLVFIYGGSFETGYASEFTPEQLLDENILLVVPNYRLGFFGFFSTGDKVVPGNMGLKDQVLALRWVKKYIRLFGGDPDRVTIMGESAGAVSVSTHMLFTADKGLFQGAISESGTALVPWAFHPPIEIKRMNIIISMLTGCPVNPSTLLVECLRSKSDVEILFLYSVFYKLVTFPAAEMFALFLVPQIGIVIEPECVEDRIATGNPWEYNTSIPWLVGANSKEALTLLGLYEDDLSDTAFHSLDKNLDSALPLLMNYQSSSANRSGVPSAARKWYLNNQAISRETISESVDMFSDALFMTGVYEAVNRANQNQTFMYSYRYVGPNSLSPIPLKYRLIGPGHTDELWDLFPHPYNGLRLHETLSDIEMSKKMVKLWANFVTYLDPTPPDHWEGNKWNTFIHDNSYYDISKDDLITKTWYLEERMQFWNNQPFPFRDEHYEPIPCTRPDIYKEKDSFFSSDTLQVLKKLTSEYSKLKDHEYFSIADIDNYKDYIANILKQ